MNKMIKVYTIDSFSLSDETQTGNLAGFVVDHLDHQTVTL
jgi:hypothetical protein